MAVVFSEADPAFRHDATTQQMTPDQTAAFFAFEQARRAYTTTRGELLMARAVSGMERTLDQIRRAVGYERRTFIDTAKQLRDSGIPQAFFANKITSTKTPLQMMAALRNAPPLPHRLGQKT